MIKFFCFFFVEHIGEKFLVSRVERLSSPGSSGSRGDEPVTQGGECRLFLV